MVKSESFWTTNRVYCQVSRSNPLPVFKWQYQNGPCLNINPECNPDSSKWKDVPSGFVISPPGDVPTARSTVDVPKDLPSGFLRCKATNTRGSDENVMRVFVSGEFCECHITDCSQMRYISAVFKMHIQTNENE